MLDSEIRAKVTYVKAANLIEANIRATTPKEREYIGEARHAIYKESEQAAESLRGLSLRQLSLMPRELALECFEVIFERSRLDRQSDRRKHYTER